MTKEVNPLSVEGLLLRADIRRKIRKENDRIADQLEWAANRIAELEAVDRELRKMIDK